MKVKQKHPLAGWFRHGVARTGIVTGDEYVTECVFCQKPDKLYINHVKQLFQCWVCGKKGTFLEFLEGKALLNQEGFSEVEKGAIGLDRELPPHAFNDSGFGWDGKKFTLPVYNYDGKFQELLHYQVGSKLFHTENTKPGLYGAEQLSLRKEDPVLICEGAWDAIALRYLFRRLDKAGVIVAVPGVNVFNKSWIEWFFRRDVIVLYDNDEAGHTGQLLVHERLENAASNINYLHWTPEKKEGYDVRDLVKSLAVRKKKPLKTYRYIEDNLEEVPLKLLRASTSKDNNKSTLKGTKPLVPISLDELIATYRELLYFPDPTPIKVTMATIIANRLKTDMIWMFLVAPPASAKSELITSLYQAKEVVAVDEFTQNTLFSGFINSEKKDYSLLGKLDGCIMAIKDFTGILSLPPVAQQAIFGQLRYMYDGDSTKIYGHDKKAHKAHFGIVAGVTSAVERLSMTQQALGERFLRYHLPTPSISDEMKGMDKSGKNMGREAEKRSAIKTAVMNFLGTHTGEVPIVPDEFKIKLQYLARLTALMRGIVDRDMNKNIIYTPHAESPHRIFKQLLAMTISLGLLEKKKYTGMEEFELVKTIAVGSCPERVCTLIQTLTQANGTPFNLGDIEKRTRYPIPTIRAVMEDLRMLGIVNPKGIGFKKYFELTELSKTLIGKSTAFLLLEKDRKRSVVFTLN